MGSVSLAHSTVTNMVLTSIAWLGRLILTLNSETMFVADPGLALATAHRSKVIAVVVAGFSIGLIGMVGDGINGAPALTRAGIVRVPSSWRVIMPTRWA